jgi:hypothetical protein
MEQRECGPGKVSDVLPYHDAQQEMDRVRFEPAASTQQLYLMTVLKGERLTALSPDNSFHTLRKLYVLISGEVSIKHT